MRWAAAITVAVAASLVLVGCTAPADWPSTVTLADSSALSSAENDSIWAVVGGSASRPRVDAAAPIERFDAMAAFIRCMNSAGYTDGYILEPNGMTINEPNSVASAQEGIEWYRCFAGNPQDHRAEFLGSIARRTYLYDYFQNSLIPCLALEGYPVTDAPTREAYISGEGDETVIPYLSYPWSPYEVVQNTFLLSDANRIKRECPEYPPGVSPQGQGLG